MSNAIMTSRQAAELDHAFERNGLEARDVKKISSGDFLTGVLQLLRGDVKLEIVERVINCDANPVVPKGSILVRHIKGGVLKWEDLKIKISIGHDYIGEDTTLDENYLLPTCLIGQPVLNANVQQYLLQYPHLAPKEWHYPLISPIVFWGTIYKDEKGTLWVPCLDPSEDGFREYDLRVDESVGCSNPVALKEA